MKNWKNYIKRILYKEPNMPKLIKRGLIVGQKFKMMGECIIDPSHCWHIKIGNNVTLAPRVHILAHDASTGLFLKYTRFANVSIGNNVFIGAGSIILPGVEIGDNVIIGAGSIVSKNIPSNSVAAGNPAKVIKPIDEHLAKEKENIEKNRIFTADYTLRNKNFNATMQQEMINYCKINKYGYVE